MSSAIVCPKDKTTQDIEYDSDAKQPNPFVNKKLARKSLDEIPATADPLITEEYIESLGNSGKNLRKKLYRKLATQTIEIEIHNKNCELLAKFEKKYNTLNERFSHIAVHSYNRFVRGEQCNNPNSVGETDNQNQALNKNNRIHCHRSGGRYNRQFRGQPYQFSGRRDANGHCACEHSGRMKTNNYYQRHNLKRQNKQQ